MKPIKINKILSTAGLVIGGTLLLASAVLMYAQHFIHAQVTSQLSSERIYFPEAGSAALQALPEDDRQPVSMYAGQQLVNGAQAKVYADNYIAAHLQTIGGGKTYSELSTESRKNPSDTALIEKVDSVFKGQTLRGLLLNAYAFDTMASVARYTAIGFALLGLFVSLFGIASFSHLKKRTAKRIQ